ncbi:MAG TPA: hypothetical protein VJ953_02785 [Saprospiraceae bacterium]|nr:hypothetical protein [Saprospiraceae bacterium]
MKNTLYALFILVFAPVLLNGQPCTGPITLTTQTEVDNFNCTSVTGELVIGSEFGPATNAITNLDGLAGLTTVGRLVIGYNSDLNDLSGLSDLESVDELTIIGNASLSSLEDLSSLTTINTILSIDGNPMLSSLAGLENLSTLDALSLNANFTLSDISALAGFTSIPGGIFLQSNALSSLNGLQNLVSVGDLSIINEPLSDLDELTNLTSAGSLLIQVNPNLTNLDGLQNLTTVDNSDENFGFETIYIRNNPSLTNIDGLQNVTTFTGVGDMMTPAILIDDNPQLNDFCGLFPVIDDRSETVLFYRVEGNGSDPSQQDILNNGVCTRILPTSDEEPPVASQDLPLLPKGYLMLLLGVMSLSGILAIYRLSN